jgi:hypothetical protein
MSEEANVTKQKRNRKKGGFAIAVHDGTENGLKVIIRDLENAAAAKSALRKRVNSKQDEDGTEYSIIQIKSEHLTPRVETRIVWK